MAIALAFHSGRLLARLSLLALPFPDVITCDLCVDQKVKGAKRESIGVPMPNPLPLAGVDRTPDKAASEKYERLFPLLSAIRPPTRSYGAPHVVNFHSDAHQHREALNDLLGALGAFPDTSTRMKAALGKYPGIYARLSLLFHLIDAADASAAGAQGEIPLVVSAATAKKAAAYVRRCLLPHLCLADQVIFLTPQTGHARWLAGFILSRGFARVTRRDMTRAYAPLRPPECAQELTSVMSGLAAMGWLVEEGASNPAREPTAWVVNPQVHTQFAQRAQNERDARRKSMEEMTAKIRESLDRKSVV